MKMCGGLSNFLKLTFRNKIVIGLEQQRREKWMSENQLADDYSPPPGNLWSIWKFLTLKYRITIKFN